MDFGAVVAYCKGWYKRSKSELDYWKDLVYCIEADGWNVFDKKDVVRWIFNRFTDEEEFFKKANNHFGIAWFYEQLGNQKRYWSYNHTDELSDDDAIIFMFMGVVSIAHKDLFEKTYKPTDKILPISNEGAFSVDDMFDGCDEQDLTYFNKEYVSNKPCLK